MIPGEVIGDRFVVEARAGAGGMATVYRARDQLDGGRVALKVLERRDVVNEERFAREARVLAELSHPALVRYVAHGTTAGAHYLAMEWLDGHDLAERLGHGPLDLRTAIEVTRRAAEALAVAHARSIIHRDIKPSNLFLVEGRTDRLKVVDFGLARTVLGSSTTRTGTAIGTPRFMAPEQVRGVKDLDERVDVYGLGGLLFGCIAGRPAFRGSDDMAVLAKVLLEEPPRLSQLRPGVPERLDRLVASMLAKDRTQRPRDAAAVIAALDEVAADPALGGDGAEPRAGAITGGEQRLLSVVMVDAAAALPLPPTLDEIDVTDVTCTPESVATEVEGRAEVERHGGRLEVLPDGTLVATLAGAGSATDQCAQAARCALALHERFPQVAIALATGRGQLAVKRTTGDVIDRVAHLLRRARARGSRQVVLDEVTSGLLAERFETVVGDAGRELRHEREPDPIRTLLGRPTPCVGRDGELAMLTALFDDCIAEPSARAVLVTGDAGAGKSRLRYELVRRLVQRGVELELWIGRGDPMREGAPFGLLAPAIRRTAGILDGEPLQHRRDKLAARIARHLPAADQQRVTEFIGELVGVPFPDEASVQLRTARRDPRLLNEQMKRAWEDLVAAETAAGPVLIVLEDLHWGDWPTAKFIDAALASHADRPLMVLALARPEIAEVLPNLWAGRPVTEIALARLSRRAAEKLVRAALGDAIGPAVVDRMIEQAAGNALYLEELIRAAAEGKGDALPESVLAMMQARLDGLPPDARRVLRAASVFSNLFWASGVRTLLGPDAEATVGECLGFLVDQEVIGRRGDRKFPAEEEYVFRHALAREAAYSMLTEQDRALGHRLAGAWLEQVGETDAVVLAEHFERGGDRPRAASWYRRAAEQALDANDLTAAVARADRGLACVEPTDTALRGPLHLLRAQAFNWIGLFAEQADAARVAMALLPHGDPAWCQAAAEAATGRARLGDQDGLLEIGEQLRALGAGDRAFLLAAASTTAHLLFNGHYPLANALLELIVPAIARHAVDDPAVTAAILRVRGVQAICKGDLGESLISKRASVEAYERAGDLPSALLQRGNLGSIYVNLGNYDEAERLLRDAAGQADRLGLPSVASLCRSNLGAALGFLGKHDEAIAVERRAVGEFVELRERRMEALARADLGAILVRAGDLGSAATEFEQAIDLAAEIPPSRAYALGLRARLALARRDPQAALVDALVAMSILESLGGLDEGEAMVRLVHAEALEACGEHDLARAAIGAARVRLDEVAARIGDPVWRESFLTRVEDNARTIALSGAWR